MEDNLLERALIMVGNGTIKEGFKINNDLRYYLFMEIAGLVTGLARGGVDIYNNYANGEFNRFKQNV